MEQFLRQLQTIPEVAELIRRVEDGGCPAAVSGLQPVQRACVGAAVAAGTNRPAVFLCGDEREVQVLSADLETLTGHRPVTLLGREWQFRPGAVGSRDWERSRLAALYALAQHLADPGADLMRRLGSFAGSPEGAEFTRATADAWYEAHVAGGADRKPARKASVRTAAAYLGEEIETE